MQSNDLNKLLSISPEGGCVNEMFKKLNEIYISNYRRSGKTVSVEELKSLKKQISQDLLIKVRADVNKYQKLDKSRRWIRRYIKRKYDIEEY
ncbi:hypothetical protein EGI16_21755 [Chryseobacterium sp. G0240]|uniref:hypothetical protein n=1 Tax=Chryseobacterium sp. G0240 TaxID=2487066 RepID=UPI000F44989B|nr:hypothetical protein [Chryseobacterium sp. G0240]ROH98306.1 hypothetical protein EGI16_21755 [Chryseobacterium sp. G0240]